MKIFVGQIYIKAGVAFPFSLRFQQWLGDALSKRVEISPQFDARFGEGFGLGFRISAKEALAQTEIKGPTVFRRDKTVEFTLFLPYRHNGYRDPQHAASLVRQLLQSAVHVLEEMGLDARRILDDMEDLQAEFVVTPGLLEPVTPNP